MDARAIARSEDVGTAKGFDQGLNALCGAMLAMLLLFWPDIGPALLEVAALANDSWVATTLGAGMLALVTVGAAAAGLSALTARVKD